MFHWEEEPEIKARLVGYREGYRHGAWTVAAILAVPLMIMIGLLVLA
jgi:hypothetical protein